MRKSIKRSVAIALGVLTCSLGCVPVMAETTNFVADTSGDMLPIPETYEVTKVIKNLQGTSVGFKNAEDIYVDKQDNIYVADTGNNRVLKMDINGTIVLELTTAFGKALNKPKGIFVDDEKNIWVADSGNQRIAVVTEDGKDYLQYEKPSGVKDSRGRTFDVEKICVNNMGYIFALKGAYIMKMDAGNTFQGYMGAKSISFSFTRFIIRNFGSEEQRKSTEALKPTSYNNFMIAGDGNTYGVLSEGSSGQIRRLNSVGSNTYPEQSFGFANYIEQGEILPKEPIFNDIAVDAQGIISVVDKGTGLIYQYDREGNLLTTFGGKGDKKGMFKTPLSIAIDSRGRLYVLDYSAGSVQVFSPTQFIELVHQAINLQLDGDYKSAQDVWERILKIDSGYFIAHKGIGKIQYKQYDYNSSMDSYYMAEDKAGYSAAFSEARHEIFRDYFFWIILIIIAVVVIIGKLFVMIKVRANKWAFNIEMKGEL